jgi:nucleotide-binding universal stress UspA family protein
MRVLIPVLDSVNALPAARYVIREFHATRPLEVQFFHVRSRLAAALGSAWMGRTRRAAQQAAAEKDVRAARQLLEAFGVPSTVRVKAGERAELIAAAARRPGIDLVVLGAARYRSATRMTEDGVIRKLLDGTAAPLVVVTGKDVSPLERYGIAAGLAATLGWIVFA